MWLSCNEPINDGAKLSLARRRTSDARHMAIEIPRFGLTHLQQAACCDADCRCCSARHPKDKIQRGSATLGAKKYYRAVVRKFSRLQMRDAARANLFGTQHKNKNDLDSPEHDACNIAKLPLSIATETKV
jgi:hypothetical protein